LIFIFCASTWFLYYLVFLVQYEAQLSRLKAEQNIVQDQITRDRVTVERLETLLDQARQESINAQATNQELQNEISRLKQKVSELQSKLYVSLSSLLFFYYILCLYIFAITVRQNLQNLDSIRLKRRNTANRLANCVDRSLMRDLIVREKRKRVAGILL